MFSLNLNKKNTKYLIQSIRNIPPITKTTLDWNIENKQTFYGCIKWRFLRKPAIFIISREKEKYRLICFYDNMVDFYLIEDIDAFLRFVRVEELETSDPNLLSNTIENTKLAPYTGIAKIDGDKLYLYDCVFNK